MSDTLDQLLPKRAPAIRRKKRQISERKGRVRKRLGLPKGMWHPQLVGVVPAYPRTQEAWQAKSDLMRQQLALYNAEGITGRSGVPDGWAGKKALIKQINDAAAAEAKDIVDKMIDEKVFEPDCKEARLAMEALVKIVVAEKHTPENQPVPLYGAGEVNKAAKTILDYSHRKPVSKQEVKLETAEDFLAKLAGT